MSDDTRETANRERFFRDLAHQLKTQDGMDRRQGPVHATAHPVYQVQQKRRIYGVEPSFADGYETGEEVGYVDIWEIVPGAVALTREGIEDYLRCNAHNLTEPRIFIASMWRVDSMIELVRQLKALGGAA